KSNKKNRSRSSPSPIAHCIIALSKNIQQERHTTRRRLRAAELAAHRVSRVIQREVEEAA
ncbi:hypothetical protein AKJ16_DCAP09434, partial [Drosera capensis]